MLGQSDWKEWFSKIKWQLISFKFLSFWVFILLLVFSLLSLGLMYKYSIVVASDLFKKGYITKENVTTIITHSQTVLFDVSLSHLLLFFGAAIGSVIAIKGVS